MTDEVYVEMVLFHSLGEVLYENLIASCNEGERIEVIGGAIDRLNDGSMTAEKPSDEQILYIMAGMESSAQKLGHEQVVEYVSRRLEKLIP